MFLGGPDPDPRGTFQLCWSTGASLSGSIAAIGIILFATKGQSEWSPDIQEQIVAATLCSFALLIFLYSVFKLCRGWQPEEEPVQEISEKDHAEDDQVAVQRHPSWERRLSRSSVEHLNPGGPELAGEESGRKKRGHRASMYRIRVARASAAPEGPLLYDHGHTPPPDWQAQLSALQNRFPLPSAPPLPTSPSTNGATPLDGADLMLQLQSPLDVTLASPGLASGGAPEAGASQTPAHTCVESVTGETCAASPGPLPAAPGPAFAAELAAVQSPVVPPAAVPVGSPLQTGPPAAAEVDVSQWPLSRIVGLLGQELGLHTQGRPAVRVVTEACRELGLPPPGSPLSSPSAPGEQSLTLVAAARAAAQQLLPQAGPTPESDLQVISPDTSGANQSPASPTVPPTPADQPASYSQRICSPVDPCSAAASPGSTPAAFSNGTPASPPGPQ